MIIFTSVDREVATSPPALQVLGSSEGEALDLNRTSAVLDGSGIQCRRKSCCRSLFNPSTQSMESFFSSSERSKRKDAGIISARQTKWSAIAAGVCHMGNAGLDQTIQ